jgi:hypothetical protein
VEAKAVIITQVTPGFDFFNSLTRSIPLPVPFICRKYLEALQCQEIRGAVGKVTVVVDDENPPLKPQFRSDGRHTHADTLDEAALSELFVSDIAAGWREEASRPLET